MVTPKDQPVNCRYGPGAVWLAVSALKLGASAEILGRDDANAWWYIKDPLHPGAFCWVSMAVTNASGKLEGLPIIPPPEAQVIDASVSVNVAPGGVCPGPISTCLQRLHHHQWACHGHLSLGNSRRYHAHQQQRKPCVRQSRYLDLLKRSPAPFLRFLPGNFAHPDTQRFPR
jgi:hypothetical protein